MSATVGNGTLFVSSFITILVIMDPFGNVPIFVALTRHDAPERRHRIALEASALAAGVIIAFALFGQVILSVLGISLQALEVAGGLLLGLVALELLQPWKGGDIPLSAPGGNVAFVPLGTPLLAGPGAIATTMVSMQQAHDAGRALLVVLALVLAMIIVYLALRFGTLVSRIMSESTVRVVSQIMGLLVAAIAVQLVAGAAAYWVRHGVH